MKIKIGYYYFITGDHRIGEDMWRKIYPNNLFGKVIRIDVRYSPFDGRKLPDKITLRCYTRKRNDDSRHPHRITTPKYLKEYKDAQK